MEEIKTAPILYSKGSNNQAVLILHGFAINIEQTDMLFDFFRTKGYTVARPVFPGHDGTEEQLKKFGPKDWFIEAKKALAKLSEEVDSIHIVGISFGSNIGTSLCVEGNEKIKSLSLMEMPIFFNLKIWLILNFIQPIFSLIGIDFIRKEGFFYRKNSVLREGSFALVPVKIAGEIRNYVKRKTMKEIGKLKIPVLAIYAEKSDMVDNKKTTQYICEKLPAEQRKIYCAPIDNHDLSLLDDGGKIILLENVYKFISKL
ncbi:MAG: Esterase/lipase-like protein [Parcubacteria group bacterium GW2011_GWE2_38_18]|nr:MAG: Esterase/lipase-like protein [Parcubacteria group bacterium GW2011_GWE2_38_18]